MYLPDYITSNYIREIFMGICFTGSGICLLLLSICDRKERIKKLFLGIMFSAMGSVTLFPTISGPTPSEQYEQDYRFLNTDGHDVSTIVIKPYAAKSQYDWEYNLIKQPVIIKESEHIIKIFKALKNVDAGGYSKQRIIWICKVSVRLKSSVKETELEVTKYDKSGVMIMKLNQIYRCDELGTALEEAIKP